MRGAAIVVFALCVGAPRARADLPPIQPGEDFAIDLYGGAALGSSRIVGMGGAAIASAEGSAGTIVNPAAAAVRPSTSTTRFDWDWHLDGQQAIASSDLDNNGRDRGGGARLLTFGLVLDWRDWSLAAVATQQTTELGTSGAAATTMPLEATATRARVAIAHTWGDEQYTIGAALDAGTFDLSRSMTRLFAITGSSLAAGLVWREPRGNWRLGATASLPVSGTTITVACDPSDPSCAGLILPSRVEVPWQAGAGVAYRWGETGWNQWVAGDLRDEHAVLVALDVLVSGAVADGVGLEAFGEGLEQRSGAHAVVSVRGGVEWELLPGHVRVRGGSYWEPGRFDGVGGRPHVTFGLEGGAIDFDLWGRRRLRITATTDVAPRYATASISIGFWH